MSVVPEERHVTLNNQPWVWPAYYALCGYWLLDGAFFTIANLGIIPIFGRAEYIGAGVGVLTILIAVGMFLRAELIRTLVTWVMLLEIVFGVLGLVGGVFASGAGVIGLVMVIVNLLRIGAAAFTIYLIGETDRAPSE